MNRDSLLLVGGASAIALFALGWYLTSSSSSSSSAPQNAVNPDAQVGAGAYAQGTMPDIGNLLSYNQPVGVTVSAPQATSVTTGIFGG
jgi:hypothetical protein